LEFNLKNLAPKKVGISPACYSHKKSKPVVGGLAYF